MQLGSAVEAAVELHGTSGPARTTVSQIAERAGVSEPTIYSTVGSKSGLLQALMQEAMFGPRFQEAQKKHSRIKEKLIN